MGTTRACKPESPLGVKGTIRLTVIKGKCMDFLANENMTDRSDQSLPISGKDQFIFFQRIRPALN